VRSVVVLAVLMISAVPAPARADWLPIPFAGTAFGGETAFVDLEGGSNSAQTVFGASAAWLSDQVLGFEGDVLYGPSFFERGGGTNLIVDSYVSTLSGGVILALPLSVTQESLRPYVTAGVGMMHAGLNYSLDFLAEDRTLTSMQVGGGAIGFVSPRTGFRFDVRHVRSLSREDSPLTGTRRTKLSFWRFTIGVVVRLG
jgi:hypothetical protein